MGSFPGSGGASLVGDESSDVALSDAQVWDTTAQAVFVNAHHPLFTNRIRLFGQLSEVVR